MVEIIDIKDESNQKTTEVSVGIVDNELIRFALRHIIINLQDEEAKYRYDVTWEYDYGEELMELFRKGNLPDILILDVSKPPAFVSEVMKFLKDYFPHVKILATSNSSSYDEVDRILKDGAKGFLKKGESINYLIDALNTVNNNQLYLSDAISKEMLSAQYGFQTNNNPEKLNKREVEFLKYCCTEMTYKEIAETMGLSARTIDGYRDAMFEKLGVKSRVGLVLFAIRNGIAAIEDNSEADSSDTTLKESKFLIYGGGGTGKTSFVSLYSNKATSGNSTENIDSKKSYKK